MAVSSPRVVRPTPFGGCVVSLISSSVIDSPVLMLGHLEAAVIVMFCGLLTDAAGATWRPRGTGRFYLCRRQSLRTHRRKSAATISNCFASVTNDAASDAANSLIVGAWGSVVVPWPWTVSVLPDCLKYGVSLRTWTCRGS